VPEDVLDALPDLVAETVGVFVLLVVADVVDEDVTVGVTLLVLDILAEAETDGDPVDDIVENVIGLTDADELEETDDDDEVDGNADTELDGDDKPEVKGDEDSVADTDPDADDERLGEADADPEGEDDVEDEGELEGVYETDADELELVLGVGEELAETVAVGLLDAAADREDLGLVDEETVDVRVAAVLGVAAVDLDDPQNEVEREAHAVMTVTIKQASRDTSHKADNVNSLFAALTVSFCQFHKQQSMNHQGAERSYFWVTPMANDEVRVKKGMAAKVS
jgi:hypothetical protein